MKTRISRFLWFVFGVVLNSFGIAFITKAALGTSPISSLPYVLSFAFPLSLGAFSFILNMVYILAQILLLRRAFKPVQLFQIVVNLVFSAGIDVSMSLLSWLQPAAMPGKLLSLLVGCAILGLGISIEVAPNVLMVPGEGIVKALSTVTRKKFGTVKIAFDVTLIITAGILSFVFFGRLQGLGIGTVVSALIVGKFVNIYNRYLPLLKYIAGLAEEEPEEERVPRVAG